jgi:hypothetical protein
MKFIITVLIGLISFHLFGQKNIDGAFGNQDIYRTSFDSLINIIEHELPVNKILLKAKQEILSSIPDTYPNFDLYKQEIEQKTKSRKIGKTYVLIFIDVPENEPKNNVTAL